MGGLKWRRWSRWTGTVAGLIVLGVGFLWGMSGLAAGVDSGLWVGVGGGAGRWADPVGALRWACSSPPWVSGMVSEASGGGVVVSVGTWVVAAGW